MRNLFIFLLCLMGIGANGMVYYVTPTGQRPLAPNDAGYPVAVTGQSAYRRLSSAASSSAPGDIIYLMNGTHLPVVLSKSGTASNYITFQNYPGHNPLIYTDSWAGIKVYGASYIKMIGLKVQGNRTSVTLQEAQNQLYNNKNTDNSTNTNVNCYSMPTLTLGDDGKFNGIGIFIIGPNLAWSETVTTIPHHIEIRNCEIFDCTSSGIAAQNSDYVTISNCKVYKNCWYTKFGTSAINFYQPLNVDGTTTVHNIVENNLVYDNKILINPTTTQCKKYDGNAIIFDDFRGDQSNNKGTTKIKGPIYSARTIARNNIVAYNGGTGISVYLSHNIDIYNNTCAFNGQLSFEKDYIGPKSANLIDYDRLDRAEISLGGIQNVNVRNNILYSSSDNIIDQNVKRHAFFIYPSGIINNLNSCIFSHNLLMGPSVHRDPLATSGFANLDQVEPAFRTTDVNSIMPFRPINPQIQDLGVKLSDVSLDYVGSARPAGFGFDFGVYETYNDCKTINIIAGTTATPLPFGTPSTISSGQLVNFFASNQIILKSDFKALSGSNFRAVVIPCVPSAPQVQSRVGDVTPEFFVDATTSNLDFHIHPNPITSGNLNFGRTVSNYTLMNSTGAIMQQGANAEKLDATGLSKGLYMLKLDDKIEKVIVE